MGVKASHRNSRHLIQPSLNYLINDFILKTILRNEACAAHAVGVQSPMRIFKINAYEDFSHSVAAAGIEHIEKRLNQPAEIPISIALLWPEANTPLPPA